MTSQFMPKIVYRFDIRLNIVKGYGSTGDAPKIDGIRYREATQQEIDNYLAHQTQADKDRIQREFDWQLKQNLRQQQVNHSISTPAMVDMFFETINENVMTNQQRSIWKVIRLHLITIQLSAILDEPWNVPDGLRTQFKDLYETFSNTEKAMWDKLHKIIVLNDPTSPFALIYTKETP